MIQRIAIMLSFLVFLLSCSTEKHSSITFLFPEGYRGKLILSFSQTEGTKLRYNQSKSTIINIPRDGKLLIYGKNPFKDWHSLYAQYVSSGKEIKIFDYAEYEVEDHEIALRPLGLDEETGDDWFVLGDALDAALAMDEKLGWEIVSSDKIKELRERIAEARAQKGISIED